MTTALDPTVIVEASGIIRACSWCLSREQLIALQVAFPRIVSHSLCPSCQARLAQETA